MCGSGVKVLKLQEQKQKPESTEEIFPTDLEKMKLKMN